MVWTPVSIRDRGLICGFAVKCSDLNISLVYMFVDCVILVIPASGMNRCNYFLYFPRPSMSERKHSIPVKCLVCRSEEEKRKRR